MDFTITSDQIFKFCLLLAAMWGVWKIIKEVKKPSDDYHEKIDKHDELLENDNRRLKEVEASNKMILQSLLVIINHSITDNGIDKMKEIRDKLQEYLITK